MKENHTKNFSLGLPKELKTRLEKDAEEKMTSQSSLVRQALDNHLSEVDS